MTRIVIVDENDTPIGLKERDEVGPKDISRGSGIWITNTKGNVLLARRAFTKKHDPGKWGAAVVGAVDEGEEYDDNAVKEAYEELGLSIDMHNLVKGPKRFVQLPGRQFFLQWYFYTTDVAIERLSLQSEEVAEAKWFTREELKEAIKTKPEYFFGNIASWIEYLLETP
ncbi:hypothetical protein A3A38_03530 [Candidatus Kaiserbacteria bacterium RIFCSPLOWO2_01_FULL_53_17]|uniref:Nudix hydrolase domain-containing protein n=1 Tax=Candidatus Kaiserbacteria bacterium RIFCSPLOWO2_01_FULL_53_17 TaxID=1798511 RepID=A0A1F6EHP1_9BACT|nr:MAG: hypothetical protein A3A38_03530 [Candidatus Kaiserbacteria bacterium RIFCSPLOWO2_01_FULL_53_17]